MSWIRQLLVGEWGEPVSPQEYEYQLSKRRSELRQMRRRSAGTGSPLERLQDENDELKLYVAALTRILVSKNIATSEEIEAIAYAIDKEDGKVDGKAGGPLRSKIKKTT